MLASLASLRSPRRYKILGEIGRHEKAPKLPCVPEHLATCGREWRAAGAAPFGGTPSESAFQAMFTRPPPPAGTSEFEAEFRAYLAAGVPVQRLLPDILSSDSVTRSEARLLELSVPESGSMRLGFKPRGSFDTAPPAPLTSVTRVSQDPCVALNFDLGDPTAEFKLVVVAVRGGEDLLFMAGSFKEATLLIVGLGALLDRETARLGVRGGGAVDPAAPPAPPEAAAPEPAGARRPQPRIERTLGKISISQPFSAVRRLLLDPGSKLLMEWRALSKQINVVNTEWDAGVRGVSFSVLDDEGNLRQVVETLAVVHDDGDSRYEMTLSETTRNALVKSVVTLEAKACGGGTNVAVRSRLTGVGPLVSPAEIYALQKILLDVYGEEGLLLRLSDFDDAAGGSLELEEEEEGGGGGGRGRWRTRCLPSGRCPPSSRSPRSPPSTTSATPPTAGPRRGAAAATRSPAGSPARSPARNPARRSPQSSRPPPPPRWSSRARRSSTSKRPCRGAPAKPRRT
jgi:hypothetical protein